MKNEQKIRNLALLPALVFLSTGFCATEEELDKMAAFSINPYLAYTMEGDSTNKNNRNSERRNGSPSFSENNKTDGRKDYGEFSIPPCGSCHEEIIPFPNGWIKNFSVDREATDKLNTFGYYRPYEIRSLGKNKIYVLNVYPKRYFLPSKQKRNPHSNPFSKVQ